MSSLRATSSQGHVSDHGSAVTVATALVRLKLVPQCDPGFLAQLLVVQETGDLQGARNGGGSCGTSSRRFVSPQERLAYVQAVIQIEYQTNVFGRARLKSYLDAQICGLIPLVTAVSDGIRNAVLPDLLTSFSKLDWVVGLGAAGRTDGGATPGTTTSGTSSGPLSTVVTSVSSEDVSSAYLDFFRVSADAIARDLRGRSQYTPAKTVGLLSAYTLLNEPSIGNQLYSSFSFSLADPEQLTKLNSSQVAKLAWCYGAKQGLPPELDREVLRKIFLTEKTFSEVGKMKHLMEFSNFAWAVSKLLTRNNQEQFSATPEYESGVPGCALTHASTVLFDRVLDAARQFFGKEIKPFQARYFVSLIWAAVNAAQIRFTKYPTAENLMFRD